MAKKKSAGGVNKSQAVRDYLAANPDASPNDIVAGLKQQGITVSPGLASNVKYTSRSKAGKRGRPAGRGPGRPRSGNGALTAADLIEAKRLADQLGGVEKVRKALIQELR